MTSTISVSKRAFAALIATVVILLASPTTAFALTSDGTFDTTFNPGGIGFNDGTFVIKEQSDGKALIGGRFTTYNGTPVGGITRLNVDGSIDGTFSSGTGFTLTSGTPYVATIGILSDGSILVGGNFNRYDGVAVAPLVRLSATGALDTTFAANLGAFTNTGSVLSVVNALVLPDNSVVFTGDFLTIKGTSVKEVAKISATGVVDTTFNANLGAGLYRADSVGNRGTVQSIVRVPSGNIVIGGIFSKLNDVATGNIAMIEPNGTPVTTFTTNAGSGFNNSVYSIAAQADGKIVVTGIFSSFNTNNRNRLARINSDGSLDTNFNSGGSGIAGFPTGRNVSIDKDQNILVALDSATTFNGVAATQVFRLNTSGTLDTTFAAPVNASSTTPLSDGKIFAGGSFTTYKGTSVGRIVRLTASPASVSPAAQTLSGTTGQSFTSATYTPTSMSGTVTYSISPGLPAGLRFDSATGVISGTPTVTLSVTNFTVSVTDGTNTVTATISLTVVQGKSEDTLARTGAHLIPVGLLGSTIIALGIAMTAARRLQKK